MTDISNKIKSLLASKGRKQIELVSVLGLSSRQALANKFSRNAWSAEDLIKVCDYLECTIYIDDDNGDRITLNPRKQKQ